MSSQIPSLTPAEMRACAFEEARCYAENNAIPELTRFNIYMTEDDIRQMA